MEMVRNNNGNLTMNNGKKSQSVVLHNTKRQTKGMTGYNREYSWNGKELFKTIHNNDMLLRSLKKSLVYSRGWESSFLLFICVA